MSSATAIDGRVTSSLNNRRKSLSRGNDNPYAPNSEFSKKKHLKSILKTPYLYMLSTKDIQERRQNKAEIKKNMEESGNKFFTEDDMGMKPIPTEEGSDTYTKSYTTSDYAYLKNSNYGNGPILLSNTELSKKVGKKIKFGMEIYSPRGKKDRPYRPNAGIKGLSSEYLSSGQQAFVRQVTVNWTCFTLEDLNVLQERFMTLGRKVYVEWGWAKEGLMPTPIFLKKTIDEDGNYEINEELINDKEIFRKNPDTGKEEVVEIQSAAKLLKEEILNEGKGEFDAIIGYIEGFEFSQREDGGFDCTTSLSVNGGNVFKAKADPEPTPMGKPSAEDMSKTKSGFTDKLNELPRILNEYLDSSLLYPVKKESIYEDYTTADSSESTDEEKSFFGQLTTGGLFNEENKYRKTTTVQGLSTKSSEYKYNQNAIVKVDISKFYGDFTKSGNFAPGKEGTDKHLKKIQKKVGLGKLRGDKKEEMYALSSWVRYGWFEDNVLNKYFALVDPDNNVTQQIRSVTTYSKKDAADLEMTEKQIRKTQKKYSMQSGLEIGEETVTLTEKVKNKQSSICSNNKAFKTPNINNFIFPGQFDLKGKGYNIKGVFGDLEKVNNLRTGDTAHKGTTIFESNAEAQQNNKEYNAAKEYQEYLTREESRETEDTPENVEELQELLRTFRMSSEDLDMNETAIVPYLELKLLEKVVQEIAADRPFSFGDDGLIRNIFINVDKLIKIFTTPADTLGANFSLLRQTLLQESRGLIDIKATMTDFGEIVLEDPKNTKQDAIDLINMQEKGQIYEFPVHTHDSFVESQEIASDMGSKMQQIMMSKQFASQAIKDEHGNLIAQAITDGIIGNTTVVEVDKEGNVKNEVGNITPVTETPFIKSGNKGEDGWASYGQLHGDEDLPMAKGKGSPLTVNYTDEELEDKRTVSIQGDTEADAEQMGTIFEGINTEYTIDGKLKKRYLKEMEENLKFTPVDAVAIENKTTGEILTYKIVPTTDETWGLLFVTNTITMVGIAGIKPGDVWTTSYLPKKFKDNAHLSTINVSQTIDSSGWKTTITGRVNMNLKLV